MIRVLICSDGSTQADQAIEFGGLIAGSMRAETTLLGITEESSEESAIFDSLRQGQQRLKEHGVDAELVIKAGEPVAEITMRATSTAYDLVVIGAVKKGSRGPFLMSAKAYKIIKAVEPPVLVVIGERPALKRILVCSGGEKYIDKAIGFTGAIAKETGATITVFHVMAEPPALYADLIEKEEDVDRLLTSGSDLGRNLNREREMLDSLGVKNETHISHGLVTSEVFKEIARGDYDMVVTGSSPAGGSLRTYIMGNITREIVNRAQCPVLVVRTAEQPGGPGRGWKGVLSDITHAFSGSKGE
jgi:nucleotide-binding universal stress UspA family protein